VLPLFPAAHRARGEHREDRDARGVEHELVGEVDAALEELAAEEVVADVPVERRERCAHEEQHEAPEEDQVAAAGRRLADFLLQEGGGERFAKPLSALGRGNGGGGGARPPEADVLHDAPDKQRHGGDAEEVDADFAPERDIPEGGAHGKIVHDR
jgi:hypothetical protein